MVKFKLRANRYGQLYLPKVLQHELGRQIEAIADARAALIFVQGLSAAEVLESLKVINAELEHRSQVESYSKVAKSLSGEVVQGSPKLEGV